MREIVTTEAKYAGDFSVALTFSDGHCSLVNVGDWIRRNPHPQYNRFLDERKFKTFYIDHTGNVAWGKNRDLSFPLSELYAGQID